MPLVLPKLDDRRYADLVEEALAMIPVHAPEWTNHNASDPGITLVELLAYLTEILIYRLDRVTPENVVTFLNLIDEGGRKADDYRDRARLTEEVREVVTELRKPYRAVTYDDYNRLAVENFPGEIARAFTTTLQYKRKADDTNVDFISVFIVPVLRSSVLVKRKASSNAVLGPADARGLAARKVYSHSSSDVSNPERIPFQLVSKEGEYLYIGRESKFDAVTFKLKAPARGYNLKFEYSTGGNEDEGEVIWARLDKDNNLTDLTSNWASSGLVIFSPPPDPPPPVQPQEVSIPPLQPAPPPLLMPFFNAREIMAQMDERQRQPQEYERQKQEYERQMQEYEHQKQEYERQMQESVRQRQQQAVLPPPPPGWKTSTVNTKTLYWIRVSDDATAENLIEKPRRRPTAASAYQVAIQSVPDLDQPIKQDAVQTAPELDAGDQSLPNRVKSELDKRKLVTTRLSVKEARYKKIAVRNITLHLTHDAVEANVIKAANEELSRFFHPLIGWRDGKGWPFGRNVYLSEIIERLAGLAGVDYVDVSGPAPLLVVGQATPQPASNQIDPFIQLEPFELVDFRVLESKFKTESALDPRRPKTEPAPAKKTD